MEEKTKITMPAKLIQRTAKELEREKTMNAIMDFTHGKQHKEALRRGFMAGIKFYKDELLKY